MQLAPGYPAQINLMISFTSLRTSLDVVIHSHEQPTIRPFDPEQVQVTSLIDVVFTEIETLQQTGQRPDSLPGLDRRLAF